MKKTWLYFLLLLYLTFVSIDVLTVFTVVQGLPNIILKLAFSLGCVIWIHLEQKDRFEAVDFDFVRAVLVLLFVTDFILGIPAKMEHPVGPLFFTIGIISAAFAQLALILRHLRLSLADRLTSFKAIRPTRFKKLQLYYFLLYALVVALILFTGLILVRIDSSPFGTLYIFVSLISLTASFAYLLSKNPRRSRVLAFMGVALLVISDSFIGLGMSALKGAPYLDLVVWFTYAPVLLLIGASIMRPAPNNPAKSVAGGANLFSRAQGQ